MKSAIDTVINVGVGGAANVAMDYAFGNVDFLASLTPATKNAIKIGVGAVAGSMISNKYAKAAFDGIATVGAANLIASYLPTSADADGAAGLPDGTIGRITVGQRGFNPRRARVAGVRGADFMGC